MKKRIALAFGAAGTAVAMLPLFAAFEAHVINVTATIENALSVPLKHIDFGTVFPQEHLEKGLAVSLSGSFLETDRVGDVSYFIRQKPKCAITWNDGKDFEESSTQTGHFVYDEQGDVVLGQDGKPVINCGDAPRELAGGESWGVLPSLCPYISKHGEDENDGSLNSFHKPWEVVDGKIVWTDTPGYLAKSAEDTVDNWTIDLAVPCFGTYCAQDWADFVHTYNESADPSEYTQPYDMQGKVFGCDLWVEVNGVSTSTPVVEEQQP